MTATEYISRQSTFEVWPSMDETISVFCGGMNMYAPTHIEHGETGDVYSRIKARIPKFFKKNKGEKLLDNNPSIKEIEIKPIDELSSDVAQIIDSNCKERINLFKEYKEGWDLGSGKHLSPASLAVFELFIRSFNSFQTEPSIFLTRAGYLQLAWEDSSGSEVEIDFLPDGLDCYIGSLDYEAVTPLEISEINSLVNKLKYI